MKFLCYRFHNEAEISKNTANSEQTIHYFAKEPESRRKPIRRGPDKKGEEDYEALFPHCRAFCLAWPCTRWLWLSKLHWKQQ